MIETVVLFILNSFLKGYLITKSSLFQTEESWAGDFFLYAQSAQASCNPFGLVGCLLAHVYYQLA